MARGKGKFNNRRNNKRKGGHNELQTQAKRQKTHGRQYGEMHPADDNSGTKGRYRLVKDKEDFPPPKQESSESSSDESEEEQDAYSKLLASLLEEKQTQGDIQIVSEEEESADESADDQADSSAEKELEDEDDTEDKDDEKDENNDEAEVSDEQESDDEDDTHLGKQSDPFTKHFERDIEEEDLKDVTWDNSQLELPIFGRTQLSVPKGIPASTNNYKEKDLHKLHVKQRLRTHLPALNKKVTGDSKNETLTPYQRALFSVINNYQDLMISEKSSPEELRLVYCLHVLNHVLKTRSRVIAHNSKMKNKKDAQLEEQYQDQGMTRPKVLMVLPFRNTALKVVAMFMELLLGDDHSNVLNKKKFFTSFTDSGKVAQNKPADYQATFEGNIDDNFCLGVGVAKKTLKLFTDFYASDIIIASPLKLKTIIAGDDDEGTTGDHDFLSSIEVLVIEDLDVLYMQNWEHVLDALQNVNLMPKEMHGTDINRIRPWCLNEMSRHYRQSIVLSNVAFPEAASMWRRYCHNWAGKVLVPRPPSPGTVTSVIVSVSQSFHRLNVTSLADDADVRFRFFTKKVLPEYKENRRKNTLIFVPNYSDFVRIHNHMKKNHIPAVLLFENTGEDYMNRGRSAFFHGKKPNLVYTERLHFHRRYRIRGVKHIIFYQLPFYAHFYSELCNALEEPRRGGYGGDGDANFTATALYSRFDAGRLAGVVGTAHARRMLAADTPTHTLVSGDAPTTAPPPSLTSLMPKQ